MVGKSAVLVHGCFQDSYKIKRSKLEFGRLGSIRGLRESSIAKTRGSDALSSTQTAVRRCPAELLRRSWCCWVSDRPLCAAPSLCCSARGTELLSVCCSCTVVEPAATCGGANWRLKSAQGRTCGIQLTKMLIAVHRRACKTFGFLIL